MGYKTLNYYMNEKYIGMTVNERLYVSNLDEKFYKAVKKKDRETVVKILKEIDLTDGNINPILKKYGFNEL